ncbi:MAG: glycosyl hydrolase-related protein, partial [Bryobacteraceae bacterium]
ESLIAAASQLDRSVIEQTRAGRDRAEWDWVMLADHAWNGSDNANRLENARLRREWSDDLTRLGTELESQAWKALNLSADPHGLVLFNSLGAPRPGLVRVDVPEDVDSAFDGPRALPSQVVLEDGRRRLYFIAPRVAGLGFASVRLGRAAQPLRPAALKASVGEIESPRYRLKVDLRTGGVASLVDRTLNRELVVPGPRALGQTVYFDGREHAVTNVQCESAAAGPVLARLKVTSAIDDIRITTLITLYADLDQVDFEYLIHKPVTLAEQRLTHVFPVLVPGAVERIETTGAVLRPLPSPAGDLLPGADPNRLAVQGFVDASLPQGPGVTIAPLEAFALRPDLDAISFEALGNDQNYKESAHDQNGQTDFRFRYSLRSHAAGFDQADTVAWSRAAATPLLVAAGRLPRAPLRGVDVDPRRAFVTAWKPADGEGLILRLWETAGQAAPLVLRLHGFKTAVATDLLERDLHALPVRSGQVSVDLRAYGFAAIRLLR